MSSICIRLLVSISVGLIGVLCFYSSINGDFVFDDAEAIINNQDVRLETPLKNIFKNDFWGRNLTHNDSHKSFRPLTVLSFRLNVYFNNGSLDPFGFHVFNLLLYGVSCTLTVPLFLTVFQGDLAERFSYISSILFAVHPIHSEAVAGIVGRADLLCSLFSLIAYLLYTRATYYRSLFTSCFITILSSFFVALAVLAKEQGITILGVCSIYDIAVASSLTMSTTSLFGIKSTSKSNGPKNTFIKSSRNHSGDNVTLRFFCRQIILLICGCLLIFCRCYWMGFKMPHFHPVDNPASFADGFFTRVINYNYIYALNAWLLLCPVWLCFDWSMGCIPLITISPTNPDYRILFVLFFWWVLFKLTLSCFIHSNQYRSTVIMGLAFLIIPFSVASNLLFRVGFVIAERLLYLPSLGFSILVSCGIKVMISNTNQKYLMHLGLFSVVVLNIARCHFRSLDWCSDQALYKSGCTVCPLNAKVHYNLARTSNSTSESIWHYHQAILLHPEFEQAMNNLANLLREKGNYWEAEILLKRAIQIRENFPAAWMNLGIVLSNVGRYDEALEAYTTALRLRPVCPDCYYNLGNLFLSRKQQTDAYHSWRKATLQHNTHSEAWNNLIVLLDSKGELERAEVLGREALKYLPNDPSLHFNLGNTMGKLKKFEEAEQHFKKAISLRPNQALYHTNLGVLYHRWKKYVKAKEQYLISLEINPSAENVKNNLKTVYKFLL